MGQAKEGREGSMKIPWKEFFSATLLVMVVVTIASPAQAQPFTSAISGHSTSTQVSGTCFNNSDPAQRNLSATLTNIQYIVIGVDVAVAAIMLGVWAFQHMTSGAMGEESPDKKLQQRHRLMQILVGLIVALMATGLVALAKSLIVGSPC
jgi:hypothetical protein